MSMAVGITIFELHIPAARSLKAKRKVVKGLVERIHRRFRVSVAETDFQDLHQRTEIAVAAVARGTGELDQLMAGLRDLVEAELDAMVTRWDFQILEAGF